MILELSRPVADVPAATIASVDDRLTRAGTPATAIGRDATGADGEGRGVFRSTVVDVVAAASCEDQLGAVNGAAKVGRTVSCGVRRRVRPTRELGCGFLIDVFLR